MSRATTTQLGSAVDGAVQDEGKIEGELTATSVLDAAGAAIVVSKLSRSGDASQVVYVNGAAAQLLGYPPGELIGLGSDMWGRREPGGVDSTRVEALLKAGDPVTIETPFRRKDGSDLWIQVVMTPIQTSTSIFVVSVATDISDRKEQRGTDGANEFVFGALLLKPMVREVQWAGRKIALTPTEYAILELFVCNPDRLLDRPTICLRIWGYDPGNRSRIVEVYVGYLRRKLKAAGAPPLIDTVRGSGYVLRSSNRSL